MKPIGDVGYCPGSTRYVEPRASPTKRGQSSMSGQMGRIDPGAWSIALTKVMRGSLWPPPSSLWETITLPSLVASLPAAYEVHARLLRIDAQASVHRRHLRPAQLILRMHTPRRRRPRACASPAVCTPLNISASFVEFRTKLMVLAGLTRDTRAHTGTRITQTNKCPGPPQT
jgi:hypothetical protein